MVKGNSKARSNPSLNMGCPTTFLLAALLISVDATGLATALVKGYPCIKLASSPDIMMLETSQVCDGKVDCPLTDDEYYCVEVGDVHSGIVDVSGSPYDAPCCTLSECLGPCDDTTEDCLLDTGSRGAPFDSQYWDECSFHKQHKEEMQCVNSTHMSTTYNLEACPWNCICCPLMIFCYQASWPQFETAMSNVTSYARIRTLKLEALQQIPEDPANRSLMWEAIAERFPYIRHLTVLDTPLMTLGNADFKSFKHLHILRLEGVGINRIAKDNFIGLTNLSVLALENNNIEDVSNGPFTELTQLTHLSLYRNPITNDGIGGYAWDGLHNLYGLRLSRTDITHISNTSFRFLSKLNELFFDNSQVEDIDPGSFAITQNLESLNMHDNQLSIIRKGAFDGPSNLYQIVLGTSPVQNIEEGAFRNQSAAKNVILIQMPKLELNRKMLEGLDNENLSLLTDVPGMCCLLDPDKPDQKCKQLPRTLDFITCGKLLPRVLKIFLWIMAFAAIIGNLIVIFQRHRRQDESSSQNVQRVLILHLAFADLLMGIYLLLIGVADAQYDKDYFWYTESWRKTNMCKAAGFLALLSSEASLFIIALISIDRFLALVFPFSKVRLRGKPLPVIVGIMWCISTVLAALGIPRSNDVEDENFGQSSVCIALPLITRYDDISAVVHFGVGNGGTASDVQLQNADKSPAWTFSIVVFLGINTLCLLLVLICYMWIYISVVRSRKSVHRDANTKEEIRMAIKMSIIVGTDFCCWLPIIIMGIVTQSQLIELPSDIYAWVIVFVLPINSSINPYLYTLNDSFKCIQAYRTRRRQSSSGQQTVTFRLTKMLSRKGAPGEVCNGEKVLPLDMTVVSKASPLVNRTNSNDKVIYSSV